MRRLTGGEVLHLRPRPPQPYPGARCSRHRWAWNTAGVSSLAVTVLAHQGGWDETLMVLTPIAVFALLLKVANTRANRTRPPAGPDQNPAASPDDPVRPA